MVCIDCIYNITIIDLFYRCKVETFEGCLNSAKAVEALRQRHVKRLIISTSQLTVEMIRSLYRCKLTAFR